MTDNEAMDAIVHFEGRDMPASEFLDLMVDRVWNEPDAFSVKLQDGRKVALEFYDPAIHGPAVE